MLLSSYALHVGIDIGDSGVPKIESDDEQTYRKYLGSRKVGNCINRAYEYSIFAQVNYPKSNLFTHLLFSLFQNFKVSKGLLITIPRFNQSLIVEKSEAGDVYFSVNDDVQPPETTAKVETKSFGILWDAS